MKAFIVELFFDMHQGQKAVGWPEANRLAAPERLELRQGCFLGCKVGMQVGLRRLNRLVIATSQPRRAIGRGEDRLNLGPNQELHLMLVMALVRYCDNSLDKGAVRRLLEGLEPEEGANRR